MNHQRMVMNHLKLLALTFYYRAAQISRVKGTIFTVDRNIRGTSYEISFMSPFLRLKI